MNKKVNLFIRIMALIGFIAAAVTLCIVFRDRIKDSSLYQKFFSEEEDEPEFTIEEITVEEEKEPEAEAEDEDEKPAPKARRGYTSLAL